MLDAAELGIGGSTRSGGMVSSGQKLVVSNAISGVSAERLGRLMQESLASYQYLKDVVAGESLDADLHISGRFFGAYTPAHFERLRAQGRLLREKTGVTVHEIERSAQHSVIGSDYYHGGIVVDEYGGLHPAKYHRSLRDLARRRGAGLYSHAPVIRIERVAGGFNVVTGRGSIRAKRVILATNGYTGGVVPYLEKRLIPVASYQIATEPLAPELMAKLNPGLRMISDSKRNLFYIRPSPDGTRMLFGSRPSSGMRQIAHIRGPNIQELEIALCSRACLAILRHQAAKWRRLQRPTQCGLATWNALGKREALASQKPKARARASAICALRKHLPA